MGKGASQGQTDIANSQKGFASSLQADFGTAFAGQQNILNGLTKSLTTTLAGGPSQFGFSAPETTAMNTLATSANSQAYQNAKAAAGEAAAAAGGGGAVLPTGSQGQTQADLALKSAQNQSNSLLGIQEAGYKQGNANYNEAVSGLQGTASLENPNGLASNANSAGNDAFNSATTIQKTNAAASPWAQVGGLVGSLGGAALNAFVPGAGSAKGALGGISALAKAGNQQLSTDLSGQGSTATDTSLDGYQLPYNQ